MKTSTNFSFNLPSRDNDDIADINQISDNFRIIDEKLAIDQTFSETSENPQSGTAVAEALSDYVPKAVAQAIDTCSPAIVTASDTGKALSIPDSSESVIRGLTAYGESTQNGTPAPDSPVEIVSIENPVITIAGKNLFDTVNSALVRKGNANISERDSNSLTVVGTTTGTNTFYGLELPYIPAGTQVTLSVTAEITGSNKGRVVFLWSSTTTSFQETAQTINFNPGTSSNKISFSVPAKPDGATTLALYLYANTNATITELPTVKYSNIQVEIGSVQTDFEPYQEVQTVTVPYTFAKGDMLILNNGIVKVNISGEETDITDTETGQALLALKTNYPTTSVISDIDLDITYKADTKNYIDNKIAALTALTLEG